MTRKKRKIYSSPANLLSEKQISHVSAELLEPELMEHSELSPSTAREMGTAYEQFSFLASLIPAPLGWGLLHCTVRDKRGRRKRVTLATDDLTYHRTFVEASPYGNRKERVELAMPRYPFMRPGWPGPPRQAGSWPAGSASPWKPAYRSACPVTAANHLHGMQVAPSGTTRAICVVFAKGQSGAKWSMLDDEPMDSRSIILIPDTGENFYIPPGIALMPGWPFLSELRPCSIPHCMNSYRHEPLYIRNSDTYRRK